MTLPRLHAPLAAAARAAVAALALPLFASAVYAQQPAGHDEGLVEVVAQRLAPQTVVVLVDAAGTLLVPVVQLARHLGYDPQLGDGTVVLPRVGGGASRLDTRSGVLVLGRDTVRLTPAELAVRDAEVHVPARHFAAMIEAGFTFDAASLTLALTRSAPFPAQQRLIAEQRRLMMLASRRFGAELLDSVPYRATTGGAVVDWQVATLGLDPSERTSARAHAGFAVFGGDLRTGGTVQVNRDRVDLGRDIDVQYHRVFPHGTALRQLRVGDISTSGLFVRFMRGVELSNRPHMRDAQYGEALLRPELPAGWEYEVFQGNELLGYSAPGSADAVAVPLRAGTTPVQVRMFGPAGEEIYSTLLYQLPQSMLRRGALEYVAGTGRCEGSQCEVFGYGDVRYGASSHVTLGAGAEYVADSVAAVLRPYALGSFTTGRALTGEMQFMPGALAGGMLSLFPRDGSVGRLRASVSRPGFGQISLVPDGDSRWDAELSWEERAVHHGMDVPARAPLFGSILFGLGAGGRVGTGLERWRASAATGFRSGRADARYDYDRRSAEPHMLTGGATVFLPWLAGAQLGRPLVHGSLGVDRLGVRIADIGASLQPTRASQLAAGAQWTRGFREPALSLTWSQRTGFMQSTVRTTAGRAGRASSAATFSGSAALANDGIISASAGPGTGYAGVHGLVFLDHDGDGVFSDGDEPLPHANVIVGGAAVTADARGRFHVWRLHPYGGVSVAVDSVRIPDPSWTLAGPPITVRPSPNTATRVDVPLIRTRELIGAVIGGDDVVTVASITVLITDLATAEVTSAVTFSDGQFYVSRLRPGRYRVAVAAASLDRVAAGLQSDVIEFTVPAGGDEPVVELQPLRIGLR